MLTWTLMGTLAPKPRGLRGRRARILPAVLVGMGAAGGRKKSEGWKTKRKSVTSPWKKRRKSLTSRVTSPPRLIRHQKVCVCGCACVGVGVGVCACASVGVCECVWRCMRVRLSLSVCAFVFCVSVCMTCNRHECMHTCFALSLAVKSTSAKRLTCVGSHKSLRQHISLVRTLADM